MNQGDSPQWWENREFEHKAEASALTKLLELVPIRKSIVDVGAGFGRLTPTYAPFFSKIALVDPSEKLLNLARDYLQNVRGVEFKKSQAEKMLFKEELFDIALCVRVFNNFENRESALREIFRVLKRNGFLIIEVARRDLGNLTSLLGEEGFEITKTLSVLNLRYLWSKKIIPLTLLLKIEERLQELPARFRFGSSVFILAQKRGEFRENILHHLDLK